jgi:beta-mannosidase
MPDYNTFKTFCDSTELNLNSKSVKAHQKHPTGYQTILTYMERDYKVPTDFRKYNYVSQLLQRDGMKTAIEAHHRAKPYCMGTLYWQLNDCWPVTSWSAIDYTYKPKAVYYETKKLFSDITISVTDEKK